MTAPPPPATGRNILFVIDSVDFVDNFGIAHLSAVAKQQHWQTFLTVYDPRTVDSVMTAVQPVFVCYSAMSSNADVYLQINRRLKSRFRFLSLMGGPHPTFFPEVIEEEGLDFICRGEGELAFAEFLRRFRAGEDYESTPNFSSKTKKNELGPLIARLDDLPLPDRGIIYDSTELGGALLKTFMSSRGCPYDCTYCHNSAFKEQYKGKGVVYRTHSPQRIVEEIKQVRARYPIHFIKFEDDMFAARKRWLEEFAPLYRREINIPFNCLQRLEYVTEERVALIKEAGGASITASIESANPRIREEILNRGMRFGNEEIRDRLRIVKRVGLGVYTSTILALPTSTLKDEYDGIRLNADSGVDFAGATILAPFARTPIWFYCREHHLLPEKADEAMLSVQARSLLTCFSEKEKDIQWNLSVFYPAMVKFAWLRPLLLWLARHTRPSRLYSLFHVLSKGYLFSRYIFHFKGCWGIKIRMLLKALHIEGPRMWGVKRSDAVCDDLPSPG